MASTDPDDAWFYADCLNRCCDVCRDARNHREAEMVFLAFVALAKPVYVVDVDYDGATKLADCARKSGNGCVAIRLGDDRATVFTTQRREGEISLDPLDGYSEPTHSQYNYQTELHHLLYMTICCIPAYHLDGGPQTRMRMNNILREASGVKPGVADGPGKASEGWDGTVGGDGANSPDWFKVNERGREFVIGLASDHEAASIEQDRQGRISKVTYPSETDFRCFQRVCGVIPPARAVPQASLVTVIRTRRAKMASCPTSTCSVPSKDGPATPSTRTRKVSLSSGWSAPECSPGTTGASSPTSSSPWRYLARSAANTPPPTSSCRSTA